MVKFMNDCLMENHGFEIHLMAFCERTTQQLIELDAFTVVIKQVWDSILPPGDSIFGDPWSPRDSKMLAPKSNPGANLLRTAYVNLIATEIVFNIQASGSHIGLLMAFSEHRRWIISVFDRRSIMNRLYWDNQQVGYLCFIPFLWEQRGAVVETKFGMHSSFGRVVGHLHLSEPEFYSSEKKYKYLFTTPQQGLKRYWEKRRDDSLMLATIHEDTWKVLNMQHITRAANL